MIFEPIETQDERDLDRYIIPTDDQLNDPDITPEDYQDHTTTTTVSYTGPRSVWSSR